MELEEKAVAAAFYGQLTVIRQNGMIGVQD